MPTVVCKCGNRFSVGSIPCPEEFTLISDTKVGDVGELLGKLGSIGEVELTAGVLIRTSGATTYQCPECSRLIVFYAGTDKGPTFYARE